MLNRESFGVMATGLTVPLSLSFKRGVLPQSLISWSSSKSHTENPGCPVTTVALTFHFLMILSHFMKSSHSMLVTKSAFQK